MFSWLIAMLMLSVALVLSAGQGQVSAQASSPGDSADDADDDGDVDGEILVKFKPSTTKAAKDETHGQQGGRVKENLRKPDSQVAPDIEVVEVSAGDEEAKSEEYKGNKKVEYAEPNFIYKPLATTANDTDFANLYGLDNTGQEVNGVDGTLDSDIDAPEAWDSAAGGTTGLADTLVAVIDTGVDIQHSELDGNIWKNPDEIADNGLDDDNNGFKDDVNGWDFFHNDKTLYDSGDGDTHGTHVAGTIAAEGNNGAGVVGVNWQAQIMPLKFLGPDGGSTANAIMALDYAVKEGAKLSNNSWGGGIYSQALKDALTNAGNEGHLFAAAAGNGGADKVGDNNDSFPSYPASYDNDNIVSVAATDSKDALGSFSNYGATSVDLAAPGVSTYSTLPGNTYGYKSGTSMATPHATGVAALIKSKDSTLDDAGVKAKLLQSVDKMSNLSGKVASGGRLNAARTLGIEPSDVTPPTISTVSPDDGATQVRLDTNVTASFPEQMDSARLTTETFILWYKEDATWKQVPASVTLSSDGKTVTLNPSSNLQANTTYRAEIKGGTGGATDKVGNALSCTASNVPWVWHESDQTCWWYWNFTTAAAPDTTAPVATAPAQSLTSNSTLGTSTVPVKLDWSATDDTSVIARYELQQSVDGGAWSGVTLSSATQTTITRQLTPGKTYTFQIRAQDGAGNWSDWKPGPTFKVNLLQEANSAISYTGTWSAQSLTNFSGGGVKYASATGRSAKLTQTGILNVGWVSTKGPNRGKAEVLVDGARASTPDLYASSIQYRKVVYVKNGLDPSGSHSLESRVLGTKNASSSGTRVDVDALVVLSSP